MTKSKIILLSTFNYLYVRILIRVSHYLKKITKKKLCGLFYMQLVTFRLQTNFLNG